ncbi:hypothetical protein K461DRAFT_294661 [Myriangium duriaei CBS 260.36]|uniref:LIM-domain binding protein-domain-containing protein n=1 Tax=Myriangium duriaei CBS 260.36 TaxID=1168546 RepID=A0A9P4J3M3_9PEZI|nr:hypothetical protein K461DRAFT_294661 [Myriangium duriaei CBS 260.36]
MPHGVPGMPPGAGQPMGHPMQMGTNVSGAGNPHMAQAGAMMGGMPGGMGGQGPGAGMGMPGQSMGGPNANAMAMSHLNPQTNLMQQQQHQQQLQQQMQNNPHLFAQQQQQHQAMLRQRQLAMQQHLAMGGTPGGQMGGLTPQQIAQMQNNPNFHGPGGLQAHQMVQLQQLQVQRQQQAVHQAQQAQAQQQAQQAQQQQAQQQQAQQQAQQAQQQQHAQQQQQQQQQPQQQPGQLPGQGPNPQQSMAHHVAMQHAPSQTSNHSAPGPSQPGQPGPPGQMRAQSQAPQGPDGPAAGTTPQPGQQNPPNAPPGQQGAQPATQAQAMQQHMRQQQLMMLRQQQAATAAAAAAAAQQGRAVTGNFILKLLSFSDHLGGFSTKDKQNNIEFWQQFVGKFFGSDGRLVLCLPTSGDQTNRRLKQFIVPNSTLPRYWYTYFQSGLQNLQVKMENAKEHVMQNQCHYVAFERSQFVFWYSNGVQVIWHGKLSAMFPPGSDKLDLLEFNLETVDEYVPKTEIQRVVTTMGSPVMTRSPKISKNTPKQRQMSKVKGIEPITMDDFPSAPINHSGCPNPIMQFLEIGETFYLMQSLIEHSQKSELRPADALTQLVKIYDEQVASAPQEMTTTQAFQPPNPQMNLTLPPQRQASLGGNRTPLQAQMSLPQSTAFSPQVANMNLPMQMAHLNGPVAGSPHIPQNPQLNMLQQQQSQNQTGSPGTMAAPSMIPQHSAQGSSSTGASANTSPNVTAKRRRSQVKVEDDSGGGPEVNGRVKASPRIGGGPNKKAKA